MRSRPRIPALWNLRYLNTLRSAAKLYRTTIQSSRGTHSFVLSPFTSDFFIKGNVTPWLSSQKEALSTHNQVSSYPLQNETSRGRGSHILIGPRLLSSELVARETKNDNALVLEALVHCVELGLASWCVSHVDGSRGGADPLRDPGIPDRQLSPPIQGRACHSRGTEE